MAGIYFHIPFCKVACHYCDFHFSTNSEKKREMIDAMLREMMLRKDYLGGEAIETIYFGGGTPSLLESGELDLVLSAVAKVFTVTPEAEITLEANPDDLTEEKLKTLRALGINRLSIGIQTFDDKVLKYLNRAHNSKDAADSVRKSQAAGFDNITIDLIYAIPGQPIDQWRQNIVTAIGLNPQHISSYSLTIEEKTVFGKWAKSKKLFSVPDDDAAEQLEILVDELEKNGYHQYEVSNFARPGFESRHNSNYWKGRKYLGIGPSAHSYDLISRQYNIANNHLYIKSIGELKIPSTIEMLSREDHINEYLLTTLRTSWGADLNTLSGRWKMDLMKEQEQYIHSLIKSEYARVSDSHLILTKKGRLIADKIASDLFLTGA